MGGRKRQTELDPSLQAALERLIEPATRGDPPAPLRWTCKSTPRLASELTALGHPVSASTVGRLLIAAGYSLPSNRKTREGADPPDRNAQFEPINATVQDFQQWNKIEHGMFCPIPQNGRGQPRVSHEVIINLIAATSTQHGLRIKAELDSGRSPTGIKVTDAELAAVNLKRADFHGEWNYRLLPAGRKN